MIFSIVVATAVNVFFAIFVIKAEQIDVVTILNYNSPQLGTVKKSMYHMSSSVPRRTMKFDHFPRTTKPLDAQLITT